MLGMAEYLLDDAAGRRYRMLSNQLAVHPLYDALCSVEDLRVFMEHHVYAVWDFMSLIKSLQAHLAPTQVPWVPPKFPGPANAINQLVLEEESDSGLVGPLGGTFASHFESYCQAMMEVGADVSTVQSFIAHLREHGLEGALHICDVPGCARAFIDCTFRLIRQDRPHRLAAVLAYGRESLVPGIFRSLLARMQVGPEAAPLLHRYLHRHIELDSDEHATLAMRLLTDLCAGSTLMQREAMEAAADALQARLDLWNGIHAVLKTRAAT